MFKIHVAVVFWLWMLLVSWKSTLCESLHQDLVKHSFMSVAFPDMSLHTFVYFRNYKIKKGSSGFEASKL